MEDPLTKRRRFLQGVGVSGTALLAGCSGILDSDDSAEDTPEADGDDTEDSDDGNDNGDGDGDGDDDSEEEQTTQEGDADSREVGIVAEPDQEALTELQQDVQTGEIEEEEAIERQQEIIQEAIDDLVEMLQADTGVEVDEEFSEIGAIRASGAPAELIDSLSTEEVSVLVEPSELEVEQPTG